jgi:hypothetical protein
MINERGRHIWQRTGHQWGSFCCVQVALLVRFRNKRRSLIQATTDTTSTILQAPMMRLRRAIETAGSSRDSIIASDISSPFKQRTAAAVIILHVASRAIQAMAEVVTHGGNGDGGSA